MISAWKDISAIYIWQGKQEKDTINANPSALTASLTLVDRIRS